jgi:hypothetical protein
LGAQTYTWNNFQNGNSIVVNPNTSGLYYVTGTDQNNCNDSASIFLNVNALPAVLASANKTLVCRGNPVILSAAGAQNYVWNGTLNGSTVQVNPTFNSSYTVEGTASDGCKNQAIVYIQVSECVGLEESVAGGEIRIYPNPVVDLINIELASLKFSELKLTDALGREILKQSLNGISKSTVDISQEVAGFYFLILSDGVGSTVIKITKLP